MRLKRTLQGPGLYVLIWSGYIALFLCVAGLPGLHPGVRTMLGSVAGAALAITLIRQRHFVRYEALVADLDERNVNLDRLYAEVLERERVAKEAHTNLLAAQDKEAVFLVCAYVNGPEDSVDVMIRQDPELAPDLALTIVQTIDGCLRRAATRTRGAAGAEWN